jgi:hypothetical protein
VSTVMVDGYATCHKIVGNTETRSGFALER